MPSTRRAILGTAATAAAGAAALAGCLGDSSADATDTTTRRTTGRHSPARSTSSPGRTETPSPTPRPLDPVDGSWSSYAFDAANTGRDPDGNGPAGRPARHWHAPAVSVFGAPVVAGGQVFVGGFDGDVVALDARTGERAWRRSLPPVSGSLAATEESVFALTVGQSSGDGDANALHALAVDDGETRWSYGSFSEAFGGLTVHDGVVYAPADEAVHAVDAETGDLLWKQSIPEGAVDGPVAVSDGRVVAATSGADLYALDAATGKRVWANGFGRGHETPTVAHGRVYVGVQRHHTDPYETPTVRALDLATGTTEPVYATEGRGPPGIAATADGLVVVDSVTDPPDRPATTPMTTPQITETPTGDETPATDAAEARKPTRAYGLAADGTERWSVELPGSRPLFGHPAVVDGVAYVGTAQGQVLALSVADGSARWRVSTGNRYAGVQGPAVVDGAVFAGSDKGVFAFA